MYDLLCSAMNVLSSLGGFHSQGGCDELAEYFIAACETSSIRPGSLRSRSSKGGLRQGSGTSGDIKGGNSSSALGKNSQYNHQVSVEVEILD